MTTCLLPFQKNCPDIGAPRHAQIISIEGPMSNYLAVRAEQKGFNFKVLQHLQV